MIKQAKAKAMPTREQDMRDAAAVMHISIRTTVHIPLLPSANGASFGQLVDQYLFDLAQEGSDVEGFELEIKPETWAEYRSSLMHNEEATAY